MTQPVDAMSIEQPQEQSGVNAPLVSVVTVCFNSERFLAEAMESVLAQTYPHIEYIIVDGSSTDSTLDIIRSFEPRFGGRLRWLSEPDNGIYDAMNKGIAMCSGELIGLLNSDDRYVPDAVEAIVDGARRSPSAGLLYGDVEVLAIDGSVIAVEKAEDMEPGKRPDWLPMCHQSLFVRSDVYEELGTYDLSYRILADYEFVLRCVAAGIESVHFDCVIAQFRAGGVCNTDTLLANKERERIRVTYGANPVWERLRYLRHRFNLWVHRVIVRL